MWDACDEKLLTDRILDGILRHRIDTDASGGIGPTHDDCTVRGVAAAFGLGVELHPELEAMIRGYWRDRFTPAALRMAEVPAGSRLLAGGDGLLPLIVCRNVYLFPGVPRLFSAKLPSLRRELKGTVKVLNGLYLAVGCQHMDNHTFIDHARPNGTSREFYKGILAGASHGVFDGKIRVRKDAQKTDARQTNKNLLLSEAAFVDTKPQLEIFADDVKCSHGATIGQLDEEALFYLRSRGIGEGKARSLLVHAFASDIVERIPVEAIRTGLECELVTRLPVGIEARGIR